MSEPLRFVFGVHVHQPHGNFDHVFADHVRDVYRPLLAALRDGGGLPAALHLSGPLLEWLEKHEGGYLDEVGRLAADGRLELLLAGFDEPILAMLTRADRIEQVLRMREALRRRFGVEARGLWLTERVWEPDLAADLAEAGVGYAFVDDRHFLTAGFRRDQLHAWYRTEHDGRHLGVLPIDERLRYLVPFRPPEEFAGYVRELRGAGHRLAVLADDGEKFGGWPGTHQWVYEKGWLAAFLTVVRGLVDAGELVMARPGDVVAQLPAGGLAYLPSASYREMEQWALPAEAQVRLEALQHDLGEERLAGPDGGLIRGTHWRNFLVKYPEANRMHKTMLALSALCRRRGDPAEARRAIARAQCNDAYWHGVFGGLYLPHLRHAVWGFLARAERSLRRGEPPAYDVLDLDADGQSEIWVHAAGVSAVIAPHRGGAVEVLLRLAEGVNLADALTRRREAYHRVEGERGEGERGEGLDSIHDIESRVRLTELPPVDHETRAVFIERVLAADVAFASYARAEYQPLRSWAREAMDWTAEPTSDGLAVLLTGGGLSKRLEFAADGTVTASWAWAPAGLPPGAVFTSELSLSREVALEPGPDVEIWRHPIGTVAKSERGLDETVQGESVTLRWPASAGRARVKLK